MKMFWLVVYIVAIVMGTVQFLLFISGDFYPSSIQIGWFMFVTLMFFVGATHDHLS